MQYEQIAPTTEANGLDSAKHQLSLLPVQSDPNLLLLSGDLAAKEHAYMCAAEAYQAALALGPDYNLALAGTRLTLPIMPACC